MQGIRVDTRLVRGSSGPCGDIEVTFIEAMAISTLPCHVMALGRLTDIEVKTDPAACFEEEFWFLAISLF